MQVNSPDPPAESPRSCSRLLQVKGYKLTSIRDQSLMLPRASFYCYLLSRCFRQGSEDEEPSSTSCQKLSGQSNVSPNPPANHLSYFHALRAGDGCIITELVFNSWADLSAEFHLPSKRAEIGTENQALDRNPATAFVTVSRISQPLDFMHVVVSRMSLQGLCLLQETACFL